MKRIPSKLLIAVGVAGAFSMAAQAQSSVTLYGSLDAGLLYVNNAGGHSAWLQGSSALSDTYFGLRGAEDLGGGNKAIFRLESGFALNNGGFSGGSMFNRQAYVGLSNSAYGTLTLGRQYDSVVDYLSPLSLAGQAGGINVAAHPLNNDNIGAQYSVANAVKYQSVNYAGFTFGGMYGFSNSPDFANGRAWSVGAGYENGPFKLAAAYDQSNNNLNGFNGAGATANENLVAGLRRTYGVGGTYAFGPGTVGLLWTHTKLQDAAMLNGANLRMDNIELNGTYGLTPALAVVGNYTYSFGKVSGAGDSGSPRWHSATLGLDYSLSKRTDVYLAAAYQHGNNDALGFVSIGGLLPTSSTNNQVAATTGLRHRF